MISKPMTRGAQFAAVLTLLALAMPSPAQEKLPLAAEEDYTFDYI